MEQYILALPSGDPNASGTASDFTIFGVDLSLDPEGSYECALIDCSFPNPYQGTPVSVFILVDFIEYQFVGSNKLQVLYKTSPISSFSQTLYYEKEQGTIVQWRQLQKHDINNVRVQVQTSTGASVPNSGFSIITLAIRRVA